MTKQELMIKLLELYPRVEHMKKLNQFPCRDIYVDYHVKKLEEQLKALL